MPELLVELLSEEIPARMQAQAARDFERMARERLAEAGLPPSDLKTFAGPRRLTLVADGLPAAQGDRSEELKGPKTSAPDQALEGFLRKTGLTREQLTERDGVWFAVMEKKGRKTTEVVAEMVEDIVRNFPWPKSMTWGSGKLRWVRPLRRILCVFDREVVRFAIDGVESGDLSEGHRFMGTGKPFRARDFDEYREALAGHFVVLDPVERKARILKGAETLCFARNLELVQDEGLLEEVAGLAEWPVPVLGDMDAGFLDLPPEVIRTSMRTHQKYFAVRTPGTDKGETSSPLAPHFITIANIEAPDGGKAIAAGNAKVLSARLSDARFFWDEDRKVKLEDRLEALKGVTFHAKLGTMYERVERIEALAREIATATGEDADIVAQAARLAKADLATGMVGEFPELQGLMGGYYAAAEGQPVEVAHAIRDHYKPLGPKDAVPFESISMAVALADKLDSLVGFFVVDETPTGSKDPYALRRAALGVIRLILDNHERINLHHLCVEHAERWFGSSYLGVVGKVEQMLAFIEERLAVALRDRGFRHDFVAAAFAEVGTTAIFLDELVARAAALEAVLTTDDGENLLAGYKRAVNILKAEEKKGPLPSGPAALLKGASSEETALIQALETTEKKVEAALARKDFMSAMTALAALRAPVDAFFDKVLVNSPDAKERDNRLKLLGNVRDAMGRVADFSLISG
jgi:glycyl-tRNA synthetase beta chain